MARSPRQLTARITRLGREGRDDGGTELDGLRWVALSLFVTKRAGNQILFVSSCWFPNLNKRMPSLSKSTNL